MSVNVRIHSFSFQLGTVNLARGWEVVSVACSCLSVASKRLTDIWFSRSQRRALGQWGAGGIKICGAAQE